MTPYSTSAERYMLVRLPQVAGKTSSSMPAVLVGSGLTWRDPRLHSPQTRGRRLQCCLPCSLPAVPVESSGRRRRLPSGRVTVGEDSNTNTLYIHVHEMVYYKVCYGNMFHKAVNLSLSRFFLGCGYVCGSCAS